MKFNLTHILIAIICAILLWIVVTIYRSSQKPKETGYFPTAPEFPCRNTPYKNQTLTSVDEIMYGYRNPYYSCCDFPKNPELPLP